MALPGPFRRVAYNHGMPHSRSGNFRVAVAATWVALLLGPTANAQDPAPRESVAATEFSRASGGEIELMTKESKKLSGTLGMTLSSPDHSFGAGKPLKGYEASFGGTLVDDRIWFFASAQRHDALQFASAFPQIAEETAATEGKVIAQLGDQHNLAAAMGSGRQLAVSSSLSIPTSFLSLHYTGVISSNMFFTASVSRSTTQPASPIQ